MSTGFADFRAELAGERSGVVQWRYQKRPALLPEKERHPMHIPACSTNEMEILCFADALAAAERSDAYDRESWLYVPCEYTEYRYILATRGEQPLICVGINPSTAEPGALDNTLKSVQRVALHNGFDSFIMFNVYAQRATRPQDLERVCNPRLHAENMAAFRYALEASRQTPAVWAAWGTIIEARPWLTGCVRDMIRIGQEYGAQWYTAGARSKKGHPHHPLYLKKDSGLDAFDVEEYLGQLG